MWAVPGYSWTETEDLGRQSTTTYEYDSSEKESRVLHSDGTQKSVLAMFLLTTAVLFFSITLFNLMKKFLRRKRGPPRRIHFSVLFDHNIRKVFSSLSEDSLNTMYQGVRAALNEHCERPPVLMFLAVEDAFPTALQIAKNLAVAYHVCQGLEIGPENLNKFLIKGSNYQVIDDYWEFYQSLSKRLSKFKVAIVSDFQLVHPQVATVLCNLADDAYSPYPRALIFLVTNVKNFFSEREIQTKPTMELSDMFVAHIMTGFLDRTAIADLQRNICGRPVLIDSSQKLELPPINVGD